MLLPYKVCIACLPEHKLVFRKKGKDGSAKCDAVPSFNSKDSVMGVVYEIHEFEKHELDNIEGRGDGYEEKAVKVHTSQGQIMETFTYYATNIDTNLKPYLWYKEHVLIGARENGLPIEYIQTIETVEAIPDSNPDRHEREMQIYHEREVASVRQA